MTSPIGSEIPGPDDRIALTVVSAGTETPAIPPSPDASTPPAGDSLATSVPGRSTSAVPLLLGTTSDDHPVELPTAAALAQYQSGLILSSTGAATVGDGPGGLAATASLSPEALQAGLQNGTVPPIPPQVLQEGIWMLDPSVSLQAVADAAFARVDEAAQILAEERPNLRKDETTHFDVAQRGVEVAATVASTLVEEVQAKRDGAKEMTVIVPDQPTAGPEATPAPPAATGEPASSAVPVTPAATPDSPAPQSFGNGGPTRRNGHPTPGLVPLTAGAPTHAARPTAKTYHVGRHAPRTPLVVQQHGHELKLGDTRREQILTLAGDYSQGDTARLRTFQQAFQLAGKEGLRLDDKRFAPVVAYLQDLQKRNPQLARLYTISGGVLTMRLPRNLFTHFDRVGAVAGLATMVAGNDRTKQLLLQQLLQAATTPSGLDLSDPRLGALAKQVLALYRQNEAVLGQGLMTERDGRLVITLSAQDLQQLNGYFTYFQSDDHSAAAGRVEAAQSRAIGAVNTCVNGAEAALTVLHLAEAMRGEAGTRASTTAEDQGVQTSPAGDSSHAPEGGPAVVPPPASAAAMPAPAWRPADHAGDSDIAVRVNDRLRESANAEREREERKARLLRSEDQRLESIRRDDALSRETYQAALDAQSTEARAVAHDSETAKISRVTDAAGETHTLAIDRRNRIKNGPAGP